MSTVCEVGHLRSGVQEFVHETGIMPACKRYQLSQFIFAMEILIYTLGRVLLTPLNFSDFSEWVTNC